MTNGRIAEINTEISRLQNEIAHLHVQDERTHCEKLRRETVLPLAGIGHVFLSIAIADSHTGPAELYEYNGPISPVFSHKYNTLCTFYSDTFSRDNTCGLNNSINLKNDLDVRDNILKHIDYMCTHGRRLLVVNGTPDCQFSPNTIHVTHYH